MTEEERAAKLAEMSGNASVHEEARWTRQKRAREADASEAAADAVQPTGALVDAGFLGCYPRPGCYCTGANPCISRPLWRLRGDQDAASVLLVHSHSGVACVL